MSVADLQYHDMLRSASKDDAQHHHNRNPPTPIHVPPSPTLSNPDMILPFDELERESSTPSPPFNLPSLSNLQSFYQGKPLPNQYGPDDSATDTPTGLAWSLNGNRPQKKNFPRHTWTHEGHDASRRLSDIGETIEEEPSSPPRFRGFPGNLQAVSRSSGLQLAPSPMLHRQREEEEKEEEGARQESGSWSSSSSSTVSAPSEGGQDQKNDHVTGHSLHMGVNDVELDDNKGKGEGQNPRTRIVSVAKQKGPGDESSSVILSSEAERILENAKKRLTVS